MEYQRISPILECNCDHPKCNGKYIQCFLEQETCLWTFLEIVDNSHGEIKPTWYNPHITSNDQTMNYTKEQIEDITKREKEALEILKNLQLTPSAQIEYINVGNDQFNTKITCYLADLKYRK